MSACCDHDHCHTPAAGAVPPGYRRALWIALAVNAAMALVEIGAGLAAGSVSLLADAVDFFGDAANYALSLAVLAMALHWRSRVALLKGWTMAGFGVFVLGRAAWSLATGQVPEPVTMGVVGTLALLANLGVALLLYAYRDGDANMRSVWLCMTRNVTRRYRAERTPRRPAPTMEACSTPLGVPMKTWIRRTLIGLAATTPCWAAWPPGPATTVARCWRRPRRARGAFDRLRQPQAGPGHRAEGQAGGAGRRTCRRSASRAGGRRPTRAPNCRR
jgi:hypothetical protein